MPCKRRNKSISHGGGAIKSDRFTKIHRLECLTHNADVVVLSKGTCSFRTDLASSGHNYVDTEIAGFKDMYLLGIERERD